MCLRRLSVSVGLAALLTAAIAAAQSTGSIEGTVVDERGRALPGVTVEATSAALQGSKMATSDESGRFRFVFLPPGVYAVRCTLAGFSTIEQGGVLVGLGRTVTLHVQMRSAFEEAITVSGAPPAIDVSSAEVGANVTRGFFLTLPIDRNYVSVVQASPGTTTDGSGPVVYGSTGLENVYYIDGINTSDVYSNAAATTLNFEFIDEVQVKTGGYAAEYGRATGGVINVITRSGGNAFHGDAFAYYFSDALQSPPSAEAETYRRENAGSYLVDKYRKADAGLDLGGYVLKDRLWFFAAYDWVKRDEDRRVTKDFSPYGGPPPGKVYLAQETSQLWSAKLTWRPAANHSLIASAFGDPTRYEGPLNDLNGEESTFLGTGDSGGTNAMLRYEGVLGTHVVVDAQASRFTTGWLSGGPGAATPRVYDTTTPLFFQTGVESVRGGLGGHQDELDTRDTARIDASFFVGGSTGAHEFKVGAETERVEIDSRWYSAGPTLVIRCAEGHLTAEGCPPEWVYYRHAMYLTGLPPGGVFDPNFASYVTNLYAVDPRNRNQAAFVQDTWRVGPTLTLNLGLRWERQEIFDPHGTLKLDLADEWAPRLGFVWDFRGDGGVKLFGSWGCFYETIPMTLSINSFDDHVQAHVSNREIGSVLCDPALDADPAEYLPCVALTRSQTSVDPSGVKGEFMDEAVFGAEVTASRDLVLGAKLVYRNLGRVVEDSMAADGYYIGNPGYGALHTAWDMTYSWLLPVPKPRRTFKGVELTAVKRMSNNWQMIASYLWSKLEGNYDGNYYPDFYGQQQPNVSAAYDYADFTVHNSGYLSNDRRHQAKVSAAYLFRFGLTAGASAYYRSGTPLSALGVGGVYGNILYLSERGAWGRTEAEYEMDVHLGYPIRIGGAEVNLLLDIFNLLNRQGEAGRDQSYNYWFQTIDVIDSKTGKPLPPIARGTPCTRVVSPENAYSCNPGFNKTNAWQDPRSVRLGVRVTF